MLLILRYMIKSNTLEKGGESKLEDAAPCTSLQSNTLEKGGESKQFPCRIQ